MERRGILMLSVLAAAVSPAAIAAPSIAPPSMASSSIPPQPAPARIAGTALVPTEVMLRATTPAEIEAHAVWNLRAALNIAALQCQFSPFLATVRTYNAALKHHADELGRAQTVMIGHFKRHDGAKGVNNFDMYTTRTYNSYSTLDAQYRFCDASARIGREALMLPKRELGAFAVRRNPDIRAALAPDVRLFSERIELAAIAAPSF